MLHVSTSTVINELKKGPHLNQVNHKCFETLHHEEVEIESIRVEELEDSDIEEAELDDLWSFVGSKRNQRWLWHAVDRRN